MDAFTDREVVEIVFVKPTQVGGTECLINMIGYIVDQDPSPTFAVYPTDTLGEHVSKNRIQPAILKSGSLRDKFHERESKLLELQFDGMFLVLAGANSPTQLASRPIRFLLLDEVDKYPPTAGKEGDAISLARERTKTFAYNKKIFMTSTPTHKTGAIWKAFEECEVKYYFFVPCPHCGKPQRLRLRQVKYNKELPTINQKAASAHYECEFCHSKITDAQKADMLKAGEWKASGGGSRSVVGFHLNAIYSPWLTFADVIKEFLTSKKDPDKLQNFINSWLAEPWEQVGATADADKVLEKVTRYTRGMVPLETMMITGGVDKQRDCFYYTIRAWGANRASWNIDHGQVDTLDEILEVFDRAYHDENGAGYYVNFVLMDSGDDTDVVYDFCYVNQGLFAPVKGSSTQLPQRYRESVIQKDNSIANGMRLIICDGGYYKGMIFRRINRKDEYGWYVFDGCDKEYAEQIVSEHEVLERVNGREVWMWKPKMSGIDNHYLDCEVYCACAADIMGAFELLSSREDGEDPAPAGSPAEDYAGGPDDDGGDWFGKESDWI